MEEVISLRDRPGNPARMSRRTRLSKSLLALTPLPRKTFTWEPIWTFLQRFNVELVGSGRPATFGSLLLTWSCVLPLRRRATASIWALESNWDCLVILRNFRYASTGFLKTQWNPHRIQRSLSEVLCVPSLNQGEPWLTCQYHRLGNSSKERYHLIFIHCRTICHAGWLAVEFTI